MKKTCIILLGPTAVGKTSLGIDLALQLNTEIISADSRQCFREMNIGVAKPSAGQLQAVRHYFINSHSITEEVNAAVFESYALEAVENIFRTHDYALMVGGTGLYIKAFTEGMDVIPSIPSEIRKAVIERYEANGLQWLQQAVQDEDPEYFLQGETENPQRMMRALEVKRFTGQSIRSFQLNRKKQRDFKIIKVGITLPREQLYSNINSRVDQMIEQGLVAEVSALLPFQHLNALQTVGYQEIFEYLRGEKTLPQAAEDIRKNTRHYAKRQLTWFRKDSEVQWTQPTIDSVTQIIKASRNIT